jgi:hypothetical protein
MPKDTTIPARWQSRQLARLLQPKSGFRHVRLTWRLETVKFPITPSVGNHRGLSVGAPFEHLL